MINDVFSSFFRTIGRILAYLFLVVVIGFLFASCEVHAETIHLPAPLTYGGYTSCNVNGTNCVNYDLWPAQTSAAYGGYYTSQWISQANFASIVYDFQEDVNYCSGQTLNISGSVVLRTVDATTPFNLLAGVQADIGTDTNRVTCTFNNVENGKSSYSCSGPGGGFLRLLFDLNGYIASNDLLIDQYATISCDATNNTIIENDNKNTQDIINNNNSNTDRVISSQDKTTSAVKENNETNKSILQKIIELPSTIINLLIDALKSLFIPEDDYFTNKFNEIRDNATAKLGILGYPFILVTDTLEFFLTIEDTGSYVIKWSGISVPNFEDYNIIEPGSFDFATLLENNYIKIAHDLYMVFINALLILSFLKLCSNKYTSVFGGSYDNSCYLGVDD